MFFFYFKWKNNLKQSLAKSISKLEKKCLQKHLNLKKCCWAVGRLTWTMVNGIISQPEPFLICFVLPDICGLTACFRVQEDHWMNAVHNISKEVNFVWETYTRQVFLTAWKNYVHAQSHEKPGLSKREHFFTFSCFSMITLDMKDFNKTVIF